MTIDIFLVLLNGKENDKNTIMRRRILTLMGCVLAIVSISAFTTFEKQEDPRPTNLKVLPKNISSEELEGTMKAFNAALGVKCGHCHAPGEKGLDFASDANPNKQVAREMMKMTTKINKKYFKNHEKDGVLLQIGCGTCHNGQAEPQMHTISR
ncbi:Photosynthetic reaction center cytochrome C subunit [Sphingobacterium wenxiniae]|uniref:Photosynthetic reaction center cytochrome c subunit n=2 Tax=Sphingobacterium wenxiniae TaxID=683125 RepID=A0A1I6VTC8_9SPHI|nr:Photosynthetic reaction center cytochrome C subunit [Sphingobacterium wenxiniae]